MECGAHRAPDWDKSSQNYDIATVIANKSPLFCNIIYVCEGVKCQEGRCELDVGWRDDMKVLIFYPDVILF